MAALSEQLLQLVLQFLNEEKFEEAAHMLEQETGLFFDLNYFERLIMAGNFDHADQYLSGFTNLHQSHNSMTIFYEIRKQKYLEVLDRKDLFRAVDMLRNDLKVFKEFSPEIYGQLMELLILNDFRENEQLKDYSNDTMAERNLVFVSIKKLIDTNTVIQQKMTFPGIDKSRLIMLIKQSFYWQHHKCKTPRSNPEIRTYFVDHTCEPPNGAPTPSPANNPFMVSTSNRLAFPPIPSTYNPFQARVASPVSSLTGWPANINPPVPLRAVVTPAAVPNQNTGPKLKRPRRPKTVINPEDNLPKTVVRSLHQGSKVVTMDFNPRKPILLVGTDMGDIGIWEIVSSEILYHISFKVWDVSNLKMVVEESLSKESPVSVNKCRWSGDGGWLGVAFSKNIVHTYLFTQANDLKQHLEIDAHIGSVNDISFINRNKRLCLVTCGDDKTIKVWDFGSGDIQYTFEGHEAPVYSICPRGPYRLNIEYIISASVDGKIKTWLHYEPRPEGSYEAPGHGRTKMTYSADGSRFFSCGTHKGESCLVEYWNDHDGTIKRTYSGVGNRSAELVMFDTAKKLLAAGDDNEIKFWDMDNINIWYKTNADGGLPARPSLCFNIEGSLLAVSTSDNGIKVLANPDGIQLLQRSLECRRESEELGVTQSSVDSNRMEDIPEEGAKKSNNWKFPEVTYPIQCRVLKLQNPLSTGKIVRLQYTNSGTWLLALDSNAKHKLWKWRRGNKSFSATTRLSPPLWQATSGRDMRNDTNDRSPGEIDPCMAVTKNSSYLMSCSGGKVSLFSMHTFEIMLSFAAPPPAATFLSFHPKDFNVVVIGREDGIILIFNCRTQEMTGKLEGHENRITGLAFSEVLNVLVSSGADAQLCVWKIDTWEKQKSKSVHSEAGISPSSSLGNTIIQCHNDQVRLLVAQDNQIAIYDVYQLERLCHWSPKDSMTPPISSATYSCDCLVVYASFCDGTVGVFDANGLNRCRRIAPSTLMSGVSSGNTSPLVIAAHPREPNQFAVGYSDGVVSLIEPVESKWLVGPSDNGVAGSNDIVKTKISKLPPM